MVARRQQIDWDAVFEWALQEGIGAALIEKLRVDAKN